MKSLKSFRKLSKLIFENRNSAKSSYLEREEAANDNRGRNEIGKSEKIKYGNQVCV